MSNLTKHAAEQCIDDDLIWQRMKADKKRFCFCHREVIAQEAANIILPIPLKKKSTAIIFVKHKYAW